MTLRSRKADDEDQRPTAKAPTESFDFLMRQAAWFLVLSATESEEQRAVQFHQKARECMIKVARSPFFGGSANGICYEGLDLVRDEVFELVSVELTKLGHRI
jgi:hypothetical protein